ncbi:MAG: hypothetical protein WCJ26_13405 [bacterium]
MSTLFTFDQDTKSWTLPHTETILSRLSYYCTNNCWEYKLRSGHEPER